MNSTDKTDTKTHRMQTETEKQKFLDALKLETTGANILLACKIAGVNRTWMYQCKSEDSNFSRAWDEAVRFGKQSLRDMAYSVIYKSLAEGDKKIAMFVLKSLEPAVWNQDKGEVADTKSPEPRCYVSPTFAAILNKMRNEDPEAFQRERAKLPENVIGL